MHRDEPTQLEMPLRVVQQVDHELIAKQVSFTKALHLCQTLSGLDDAQFYGDKGIVKDQAQWSRVMGPSAHNFPHDRLNLFMDIAGNEAPLMWLNWSRGYDLNAMRQRETELERQLRHAREENVALRRVLMGTEP